MERIEKFRQLMIKKIKGEITREQLARALDVAPTTVTSWMKGSHTISPKNFYKAMEVLEIKESDIS